MTQYMNRAAVKSWVDASDVIKRKLENIFVDSGLPAETVDTWTNDIIRNTFEKIPEPHSGIEISY